MRGARRGVTALRGPGSPQRTEVNVVPFPLRINGEYVMLHRSSDNGHTPFGDIFLCTRRIWSTGASTALS